MRIRRIMSGAMAGVMAVSSSFVMQLPASAESINATVISARSTPSWDSFPVNLAEHGKMDGNTTVKITCRVEQTDILTEDGNVPDWAFGVVINNDWSHDTMPHCSYESDKTEFSMVLTAEQLSNNTEFIIQSQLPCASEITVEAFDLQQDSRGIIELKAIDRNVVMWVYNGDWIDGSICGGGYDFTDGDIDGVEFGKTTAGELRTSVKKITTKANPYFSDTANAGADSYVYNIEISMKDADGNETSASGGEIDFTSDGNTYIDTLLDSSMDDYIITGIRLYVSAKTEWDGDLGKSRCSNEKIRNMPVGSNVLLEISKSDGEDISLGGIAAKNVSMNVFTRDDGVKYADGYVDVEAGALSGITLADLVGKYHSLTISAPGYFANSAGIDPADLVYSINMQFSNADGTESRWLDRSYTALTEDCVLYPAMYAEDLLPGAEDFTLKSVAVRVTPKMETVDGTDRPVSEALRNYTEDSFLLEFKEDSRSAYDVEVTDRTVTLFTWADDSWLKGSSSTGSTSDLTVPGIESGKTTFAELKENVKSLSASLPYYSDSIGAGQDAFCYKFGFRFSDDSEFLCNTTADIGNKLTMYLDNESESDISTSAITSVFINVEPKMESTDDGRMQAISEKIRSLTPGSNITVEFKEDERTAAVAEVPTYPIAMYVLEDVNFKCSAVFADSKNITVPGIEYGKTTFTDLKNNFKSISCLMPYYSDSLGVGSKDLSYRLVIEFEDGSAYFSNIGAEPGTTLVQKIDSIDTESVSASPITGMRLNIYPNIEEISDGKYQATSEKIRNAAVGSTFTYEPVKDERATKQISVTYPQKLSMFTFSDDNWYDGINASGQVDAELNEIKGLTADELLKNYRSLTISAPGYFSDSMKLGADAFSYQISVGFRNGSGDENWLFSDQSALNEEAHFDTWTPDYRNLDGYTVNGVIVKFTPANVFTSDRKWQAKSEAIRRLEPNTEIVIELTEEKNIKPEFTAKAGDGQVTLTWNRVDGAERYAVYSYLGGKYTQHAVTAADAYTVTGLTNGTKYGFLVRAYANGKWSAFTADDLIYATPVAEVKPAVRATAGDTKVALSWNAVPGATRYAAYYYLNGKYSAIGTTTATSVVATGLTNGTKYGFLVRAYVNGAWTSFTTADLVYAVPVAAVKPVVRATAGDTKVALSWNAVPGATRYAAYYYLNGKYSAIGTTTATSVVATGLTNGTKYGFLVRAYVNGAWTSFTTADLVYAVPVAAVKPVVRATAGDTKVALSWNAVPGATRYAAYYYLNGKYSAIGTTTATSVVATGLTNGTKYGFLVRAYVNGVWTSFTTADLVYAVPVAAVKPVVRVTAGDTKVALSWNAVPGATRYAAYYYLNGKYSAIGTTTATSVVATGLTNGTKYGFLVRAYVNGAWTSFTTADLVYAVPAK